MKTIFAGEPLPTTKHKALFLAGPSPKDLKNCPWRIPALEYLEAYGYDGYIFIPLPRDGISPIGYTPHVWELEAIKLSDVVIFWVPRDLASLPGFATNTEFGLQVQNRNIVFGYPANAPQMEFMHILAEKYQLPVFSQLHDCIFKALLLLREGAKRVGGECCVPLSLWEHTGFSHWLNLQKQHGLQLDSVDNLQLQWDLISSDTLIGWSCKATLSGDEITETKLVMGTPNGFLESSITNWPTT